MSARGSSAMTYWSAHWSSEKTRGAADAPPAASPSARAAAARAWTRWSKLRLPCSRRTSRGKPRGSARRRVACGFTSDAPSAYARPMSVPSPILAETPSVMRTTGWNDYRLIDSGAGRKLESYGPYRVARPEPQCLWTPRLSDAVWAAADAVFDPAEEEDAGHWRF